MSNKNCFIGCFVLGTIAMLITVVCSDGLAHIWANLWIWIVGQVGLTALLYSILWYAGSVYYGVKWVKETKVSSDTQDHLDMLHNAPKI
jgi:hypothetical protein